MSDVLRVQWTIIPRTAPQPWLTCSRCGEARRFRSSGKIRVNANGKRVDAWLIYKCTGCGSTWNRPILERRHVRTIEPDFLMSLHTSESMLTRRLAFDVEELRRRAGRVEEFDDALVTKNVLSEGTTPTCQLEILCSVPEPVGLRVDRLLANELHCREGGFSNWQRPATSSHSRRDQTCAGRYGTGRGWPSTLLGVHERRACCAGWRTGRPSHPNSKSPILC